MLAQFGLFRGSLYLGHQGSEEVQGTPVQPAATFTAESFRIFRRNAAWTVTAAMTETINIFQLATNRGLDASLDPPSEYAGANTTERIHTHHQYFTASTIRSRRCGNCMEL